jgi:hypothetical protein
MLFELGMKEKKELRTQKVDFVSLIPFFSFIPNSNNH